MQEHERESAAPPLGPVAVVWGIAGVVLVAILVTYTRIEPEKLYNVSNRGLAGGASRALVALNFPVSILGLAMLPIVVARLMASVMSPTARAAIWGTAALAAVLSLVTGWPGVVDQADLDAKPMNAVPAIGVALALALSIAAARVRPPEIASPARPRFEPHVRYALLGVIAFLSLPWMFAAVGFYISAVPGPGDVFVSDEFLPEGATLAAVHYGHHHGFDGAIFAASALILMPAAVAIPRGALRHAGIGLVALMFFYGLMNMLQDLWTEQVIKRGWTGSEFPEVVRPGISPAWGLMLIAGVLLYLYLARPRRPGLATQHSPA